MPDTMDLKSLISQLSEQFKPGGAMEQARFAEVEQGGRRLQAQLAGSAIQRGLGNAAVGIPTIVHEQMSQAKRGITTDLSSQYMGLIQNLAGMEFQSEEAQKSRDFQAQQSSISRRAGESAQNAGLDAFGRPMVGSWQKTQMDQQAFDQQRAVADGRQARNYGTPTAKALPALYAAGGFGQGSIYNSDSLFGEGELDLFNQGTSGTSSTSRPTSLGYGPMFGD